MSAPSWLRRTRKRSLLIASPGLIQTLLCCYSLLMAKDSKSRPRQTQDMAQILLQSHGQFPAKTQGSCLRWGRDDRKQSYGKKRLASSVLSWTHRLNHHLCSAHAQTHQYLPHKMWLTIFLYLMTKRASPLPPTLTEQI
jgi:hypothetical protein